MNNLYDIKKVHVNGISLILKYLWIRFKVFIFEDKRSIIYEFSKDDKRAEHYVLFLEEKSIGIVRIIFENQEAIIGRFGLLKQYRNKGHGSMLLVKIINNIKENKEVSIFNISLLTEDKNKGFYEKVGFSLYETVYIEGYPYSKMVITMNCHKG